MHIKLVNGTELSLLSIYGGGRENTGNPSYSAGQKSLRNL